MASARSCDSWILLFWTIFWRIVFISPMFLVEVAFSARRELDDRRVRAEVQEERLDAAALAVPVGVGVDGDEQVGPLLVGDDRPVLERRRRRPTRGSGSTSMPASPRAASAGPGRRRGRRPFPGARSCRSCPGLGPPWPGSMTIVRTPSPSWRAMDVPSRFGSFGSTSRLTGGWSLSPGRGAFAGGGRAPARPSSARVDVDDEPERVEEVIDPVGLDPGEIDVDGDPDRGGRLLGDPDLADVVGLDRVGLALEDGVELGLEDVDVDPARGRGARRRCIRGACRCRGRCG